MTAEAAAQGFIILLQVHHKGEWRETTIKFWIFLLLLCIFPSHCSSKASREKTEVQLQNVKGKHTKTNKRWSQAALTYLTLYDGNGMHLSRYYYTLLLS